MKSAKRIQHQWRKWLITLSLFIVLVGGAFASPSREVDSPLKDPPGPDRYSVTTINYTKYYWWMVKWGKNQVICKIEVDHDGLPTPGDIYVDCGEDIYTSWIDQKPCNNPDIRQCDGAYLLLVDSKPAQKDVSAKLPPSTVQVTLENCDPVYSSSTSICEIEPILVLTGVEPVEGYEITGIEGLYSGQSFKCGPICRLKLPVTNEDTMTIQFWANSSYGDTSEMFDATIRVATTTEGDPDHSYWYVDVLSSQWAGVPVATCVEAWNVLPPIGGPPDWLSTPTQSETLGTQVPYTYLAEHLIQQGAVDASTCDDGGLLPDGGVNACGMTAARDAVNQWQNQFDDIILQVAKDTGVPAHLLKNLFATESQFWPGSSKSDVGFGQLTEHGADTTFLWNPPFFSQFCPTVMDVETCNQGYLHIDEDQKEQVRLSLISAVNATCDTCPLGIDLERARFSIGVFAHTLLANCGQAGQLVENVTDDSAGASATYEDLWKFTLVNYNAGPGCLGDAVDATNGEDKKLTWENVSANLAGICNGAVDYVNEVSGPP